MMVIKEDLKTIKIFKIRSIMRKIRNTSQSGGAKRRATEL